MKFEEFETLIKEKSKEGQETEFILPNNTIDDYRKNRPSDFEIIERILASYSNSNNTFKIIYPDKGKSQELNENELENSFYQHHWNGLIHK